MIITATDSFNETDTANFFFSVNNVAPVVSAGADATVNEGSLYGDSGSFTDPGADTWTATVDYGDGSGVQPLALNPDKTFSLSHTYADNGVYTVTVTVTDDEGASHSDSLDVTVNNMAPVVDTLAATSVDENGVVHLTGTYHDDGSQDTHTLTVNWGEGSPQTVTVMVMRSTSRTRIWMTIQPAVPVTTT